MNMAQPLVEEKNRNIVLNTNKITEFSYNWNELRESLKSSSITIHSLALHAVGLRSELGTVGSTFIGNQLAVFLPITPKEGYLNKAKLVNLCVGAIRNYALGLGIQYVVLMGTIPSATNYGVDIVNKLQQHNISITITTGHATTLACIAMNYQYILNQTTRLMKNEVVGVLGCGSIGYASILLLISILNKCNYPKKILLCDTQSNVKRMEKLKNVLKDEMHYEGDVELVISPKESTNELFYECTVIIGACSRANVLDPDKLSKRCIIIDDSAPHCFDERKAVQRFNKQKDILFAEGGVVQIPEDWNQFNPTLPKEYEHLAMWHQPRDKLFSCCLGGMLLHRFPNEVEPILGPTTYQDGIKRLTLLKRIGISGCMFHRVTSPKLVKEMREKKLKLPHDEIQLFIE